MNSTRALLWSVTLLCGCTVESDVVWPLSGSTEPDHPYGATFGPRTLGDDDEYDFHRGLDISAPSGTEIYAVADGVVTIAGSSERYSNPVIQLQHCQDGEPASCAEPWYTNYLHVSGCSVTEGAAVAKGELIGLTGASSAGYEHLHLEVRQGDNDQADAVHPLGVLPYEDSGAPDLTLDEVSQSALETAVQVTVSLPGDEVDLNRVSVTLTDGTGEIDARTYDMNAWNAAYTDDEDPDLYLTDPDFNDILVEPAEYDEDSETYAVRFTFEALAVPAAGSALTVAASAADVLGNEVSVEARAEE